MQISFVRLLPVWLAFLAFSVTTTGQSADSLLQIIRSGKKDTPTVKALLHLSEISLSGKPDTSLLLAKQAASIAEAQGFKRLLPGAYNATGMACYYLSQYHDALIAFGKYYDAATVVNDKVKMGFAKNNQGNVYIELNKYDSTILLYKEALAIRTRNRDSFGIAQSYNNLGYVYKEIGDYDKAVEYMLYALRFFEHQQNTSAVGVTYNFLGQVFWKKGSLDEAINFFQMGLDLFEKLDDKRNLAISQHSMANVMLDKNQTDSAIYYYKQAMTTYENTKDVRQVALVSLNLADAYKRSGLFEVAREWYEKAIELNTSIGNNRSLPNAYIAFAAALLENGETTYAKKCLDAAWPIMSNSRKKSDLKDYHATLADYYKHTGNYALALQNREQYELYKDSLLNESSNKSIADMAAKYETEKKEQEIVLQKAEVRRKNLWIGGISAISCLLLLLGISSYRRYKLKKEKELQQEVMHQQDLATQAVMEAEENERKRIATELHDGVGQMMSAALMNLSALSNDLSEMPDSLKGRLDKTVSLVDESCKEVRVVSHSMMPNALLKRGLAAAVRDFLDKLENRKLQINLFSDGLDNRLPAATESMLYRIIQECVNNVVKHSEANQVDISLVRDEDGISLTIEDNGKGFDATKQSQFDGIGLHNIQSRVQYLKGTVEFDSSPGRGTLVAIHVPE